MQSSSTSSSPPELPDLSDELPEPPKLSELPESNGSGGWDDACQLFPFTEDEAAMESELDPIPPEGMPTTGRVAAVVILLMGVLAEFTLLRAEGFSGPAVFFPCAAALMFVGIPRRSLRFTSKLLALMLCCVSVRMVFDGAWIHVGVGTVLFLALILAFRHRKPFPVETLVFGIESFWGGYEFFLTARERTARFFAPPVEDRSSQLFNVGVPLIAVVVVAGTAVVIQPDLLADLSLLLNAQRENIKAAHATVTDMTVLHIVVWLLVMWVSAGLIRPLAAAADEIPVSTRPVIDDDYSFFAPFFTPLQNTLLVFIGLLGLVIFLHIPSGELPAPGAAANTVTNQQLLQWLGVFTVGSGCLVAIIFHGSILADVRVERMRKLMYVALGMNGLLVLLTAYRMTAAIHDSGLSHQRLLHLLMAGSVIGALGLLAGLVHTQHTLPWLFRRVAWVAGFAGFVYLIVPMDQVIQAYNVRKILDGNNAPLAQMMMYPIHDESLPQLLPLCDTEDPIIRDGANALIAERYPVIRQAANAQPERGWSACQVGIVMAFEALQPYYEERVRQAEEDGSEAAAGPDGKHALTRLREYVDTLL